MTIRLKLILLMTVSALVITSMSGWHIYGHMRDAEKEAIVDAEITAKALVTSLTFVDESTDIPPLFKSPSGLKDFIYDRLRLMEDIKDFVVVDVNRVILGDTVQEEVGKSYDEEHKGKEVELTIKDGATRIFIEKSAGHPDGIRQLVVPLKTEEGETVGAVIIEYSGYYNKYIDSAKREAWNVVIVTVFSLLIAVGGGYYISNGIAGNIARLKKATEAMAAGDLEAKAEVGSRDELGDLARSFNRMAALRQAAEEELRKKEKEFRTLIDNSQEVIQRFDRQLNRLYINPVIEKYTGIPYKEFIGKTDRELGLPEQNIAMWEKAAQKLFETGKDQFVEFKFPTPQGNTYFETHLMSEFGADGTVASILVITRDITERKEAEDRLRESEETLKAILNATTDAMFLIDTVGNILTLNETTALRLGKTKDELIGTCIYDYLPPDIARSRRAYVNEAISSGKTVNFEDERNGEWVDNSIYPIFNEQGKIVKVAIYGRYITDRKKAETERRENELRYRSLFERENSAVMIFDAETLQFEDANQRTLSLFGYTKEEFMKLKVHDISAEKEKTTVAVQKVKNETPHSGYVPLRYFVKKDGTVFPGEIFPGTFMYKGRKKIIGVVNDITERKKAEDELKRVYEELQEKSDYLERFNSLMVGRELEMIKLKAEVNELLEKAGKPKKYESPDEVKEGGGL